MKCEICSRPAIARLTVDLEALDLANWPAEWLHIAGTQNTAPLCVECLKRFMTQGMELALGLNQWSEALGPAPEKPPDTALKIAALNVVTGRDTEDEGRTAAKPRPAPRTRLGNLFTDAAGNTYTRTDKGWVLSEYGPDGPPSGALGAGRTGPKKLN